MSATATTTLSDTLVVGRQPQQSVGFHPFCPPSPSTPFCPHLRPFLAFFPSPPRPGGQMVSIPNSHPQTAPVGFGFRFPAHG